MADHRKLAQEASESLGQKDFGRFAALHDESGEFKGPDGKTVDHKQHVASTRGLFDALSDAKITVLTVVSEGDTYAIEQVVEGTHTGTLRMPGGQEIPPTGKRVRIDSIVFGETNSEGKIKRSHVKADRMQLMEQIGMMPQPAGAATS